MRIAEEGREGDDREEDRQRLRRLEEMIEAQDRKMAAQDRRMEDLMSLVRAQMLPQIPPHTSPAIPETGTSRAEAVAEPVTSPIPSPTPTPTSAEDPSDRQARKLKEFMKYRPPTFTGGPELEKAEQWIMNMEKRHDSLQLDDELRVNLSTYMLEGNAEKWWRTAQKAEGEIKTWSKFKQVFYEKYFPKAVRDGKYEEFLNLKQGSMSVTDYEFRFSQLAEFAPEQVCTERLRVDRFIWGLRSELRFALTATEPQTYASALSKALSTERV